MRRWLLAGLAAVLAAVLVSPAPGALARAEGEASLLIVLDSSGSMARDDASGGTRMAAAKAAVADLVAGLPEGMPTGLRMYGHTEPERAPKDQGCVDTELVAPVEPLDRDGLTAAVGEAEPLGRTPIGYALQQAGDDFAGQEGHRSIILVSDGVDTCAPPDPCEAAQALEDEGIDTTIHTVGFAIEDEPGAQEQLTCIAEATGGMYRDAGDADALGDALTELGTRAADMYQIDALSIDGAPIYRDAPVVEVGQAYTDTLVANESNWYAIDLKRGETVEVEAVHPGGASKTSCAELEFFDDSVEAIDDFQSEFICSKQTATVNREDVHRWDDPWRAGTDDERVYLTFTSLNGSFKNPELEYEFIVTVDPPREDPEATEDPTTESPATATAEPTADDLEETARPTLEAGAQTSDESSGSGPLYLIVGILAVLVLALGAAVIYLLRRKPQA